jgi:protein gp37
MFDLFHEAIPEWMIEQVFAVMIRCPHHTFQLLTKRPAKMLRMMVNPPLGLNETQTLKHIWLGTSVESQKYADERIPLLLQTPAAVRFLSVEPMLEAVDLIGKDAQDSALNPYDGDAKIDWVICGGESGPGARPFNLAWAESLQEQCKAANVAFFMKQVGSRPFWPAWDEEHDVADGTVYPPVKSKGGDPAEWPEHLRVRQFPSPAEKLVTA